MPPKEPQDGPRQAQDSPRRARDTPRTAQDGSKMRKNAQECTQNPLRQVPKSWLPCFAPCRHSRHARNCYKNAPANDQTNSKQPASQPANSQTATTATTAANSNHQELTGRKHTRFKASVASAGVAKRLQLYKKSDLLAALGNGYSRL